MTIAKATQCWLTEGGLSANAVRVLLSLPDWLDYDDYRPLKYGLVARKVCSRGRDGTLRPLGRGSISKAIEQLLDKGYLLRAIHPKRRGRGEYVYILAVPVSAPAQRFQTATHDIAA
jgi:hypothetical protein